MIELNERFYKQVGIRLKKLREDKKLTQEELVEKLQDKYKIEINKRSVSRYENGSSPNIDNLLYLADFYNVSVDFLLFGKTLTDDNSYSWSDTIKRLNRLLYQYVLYPIEIEDHEDSPFGKYIFVTFDEEIDCYMENYMQKAHVFDYKLRTKKEPSKIKIEELDNLNNIDNSTEQLDRKKRVRELIYKLKFASINLPHLVKFVKRYRQLLKPKS